VLVSSLYRPALLFCSYFVPVITRLFPVQVTNKLTYIYWVPVCMFVGHVGQVFAAVWGVDKPVEATSSLSTARVDVRHQRCSETCRRFNAGRWRLTSGHTDDSRQPW